MNKPIVVTIVFPDTANEPVVEVIINEAIFESVILPEGVDEDAVQTEADSKAAKVIKLPVF